MNKLTEIRNQIDEFKRLENRYNKKMEEVKFETENKNKITQFFGPPLNFVAREIARLVIESDLLSLLEEKDKALQEIWQTEDFISGSTADAMRRRAYAALTSSNNEGE